MHWLHLEVHNGGFGQYFYNSTGTSAPEAIDGFNAIGMPDVAAIAETAMARPGTPYPFEKSAREVIVGSHDDQMDFDELDSAFYQIADTEKVLRRRPRFVAFAEAYAGTGI